LLVKRFIDEFYKLLDMTLIFMYNIDMSEIDKINDKILELMQRRQKYEEMRRLRFEKGWTLQEVGDLYGLTRSRVQQITGKKNGKAAQK